MRRFVLLLVFPFYIAYACDVTDDAGHAIHLSAPAARIISLAPDLTELLFAAGAGKSVVGVTQGCDYPEAARHVDVIGNYETVNIEAVLTKKADLIIAWEGSAKEQIAMLKKLGLPVFISHQRKLIDIPKTLRRLGCLAGTEKTAEMAAAKFSAELRKLEKSHHHKQKVFYEISDKPLMTINRQSWISEVIAFCGGENVFASVGVAAPRVSIEAVLLANPDVMIGSSKTHWQEMWAGWPEIAAVKNKKLVNVNPDLLERAGPRLIEGVREVCGEI